jgi:opacity protein-like surface antigen
MLKRNYNHANDGSNMARQFLLAAILLVSTTTALAQNYEITPLLGWRTSSSLEDVDTGETIDIKETSSFGIILSMKQKRDTNYDFLFSRQDTELQSSASAGAPTAVRFDYYHLGGTVYYDHDSLQPFISGGLGATHVSPANKNFSSETKFSLSIGGGLKFPLSQNIGLRLEARGYGTVVDGEGGILCANGACIAKFTGSLFMQFEAIAGLSFAF